MTQTIEVKSNIGGRLKKIREGVVFNSVTSVIGELGQNAQRSLDAAVKAGHKDPQVHIEFPDFREDTFRISDNGLGCEDPQTVLELDVSGFGIGYGEGFSSVFLLADNFEVSSLGWSSNVDVLKMMEQQDYKVSVNTHSHPLQGFRISLTGERIAEHRAELISFAEEMASLLPYPTYLNGELVEKQDFTNIGKTPYKAHVDNDMFSGTLGVSNGWQDIQVYYENRYVCGYWKPGLCGNIRLKPGAVNLKAPDRREIIYDSKRSALGNKLDEIGKEIYMGFLEYDEHKALNEYSDRIDTHLQVEDYLPFLPLDPEALLKPSLENEKHERFTDAELLERAGLDEPREIHHSSYSTVEGGENLNISGGDEADIGLAEDPRYDKKVTRSEKIIKRKKKDAREKTHKAFMDKLAEMNAQFKVLWASDMDKEKYAKELTELRNHGFRILTAHGRLFEKAYEHLGINHFLSVESNSVIKYSFDHIGAYNNKEKRVLWLFERIEELLNSPGMFRICDIDCRVEHYRDNHLVGTEIKAVTFRYDEKTDRIYVDRRNLALPSYRVDRWDSGRLNMNDLRLMLKNIEPLAKEIVKFKNKSHEVQEGFWSSRDRVLEELVELF